MSGLGFFFSIVKVKESDEKLHELLTTGGGLLIVVERDESRNVPAVEVHEGLEGFFVKVILCVNSPEIAKFVQEIDIMAATLEVEELSLLKNMQAVAVREQDDCDDGSKKRDENELDDSPIQLVGSTENSGFHDYGVAR